MYNFFFQTNFDKHFKQSNIICFQLLSDKGYSIYRQQADHVLETI